MTMQSAKLLIIALVQANNKNHHAWKPNHLVISRFLSARREASGLPKLYK